MDFTYFLPPLIVSAISASLATVIVIIDKIVNNYGEVKININAKKEVPVQGGNNLLLSLSENKIFLPSACGGRGSCGACKAKVLSDVGPVLPTETPYLSKDEVNDHVRLSCQIKVKSNLEIEIPEELFNIKELFGKVEKIVDLTHDIKEVLIKLEDETIQFKSGQYAQLEIPKYDKIKKPTQRAYSISSTPLNDKYIEFIIRLVPGGIVTTYVHNHLKEGERVKVIGPFGDFMISDTDATMVWVAGGSGMAPFKSMVYDLIDKKITHRDIWYFFGARTEKDLFYMKELKEVEKKFPNFHFVPALSEPEPGTNWKGSTGLITDVLDEFMKNKIDDSKGLEGYLCGSPGMIDACIRVMTANNITEEKIYYDKFA